MKKPFIKFCGITNADTASFVLNAGADAIGFIAYPKSPRFISSKDVDSIILNISQKNLNENNIQNNHINNNTEILPSLCKCLKNKNLVAVFVNADIETIKQYGNAGINTVQLHGDESEDFADLCQNLGFEVWKAIRVKNKSDIEQYKNFPASKFLIDAFHLNLPGGTGKTVDRSLAAYAVKVLPAPVILAGGLNPSNIFDIFNEIKPWGLDVNSGVEFFPGKKNHQDIMRVLALWQ